MNVGIYIHVPFCAVKCPYCDFYSGRYSAKEAAEQLAEATQAEVIQCIGRKLVLYRQKEEE